MTQNVASGQTQRICCDRQTNRQTDRQTHKSKLKRPTTAQTSRSKQEAQLLLGNAELYLLIYD